MYKLHNYIKFSELHTNSLEKLVNKGHSSRKSLSGLDFNQYSAMDTQKSVCRLNDVFLRYAFF